jgi:hypothetical protein
VAAVAEVTEVAAEAATTEDSLETAVTHQVQLRIMRYFRPLDIEADIAGIITGDRCREVR